MLSDLLPASGETNEVLRGITCLRCRYGAPTEETDFSRLLRFQNGRVSLDTEAVVPIRCGKTGRARPAHLWQPCSLADDRCVAARNSRARGDKYHGFSELELQFWRALAPHVSWQDHPRLLAATGRGRHCRQTLRENYGISLMVRTRREIGAASIEARATNGRSFNAAQIAWIEECRASGLYPDRTGGQSERDRLRARLLAGVAQRGTPKTWRAVVAHVSYSSPAVARARALKTKTRKVTS